MLVTKGTNMPAEFGRSFRFSAGALASVMVLTAIAPSSFPRFITAAQAQAPGPTQPQEQIDFDAALEGYGHWVEHPSLGEVWVPDNVPQDWQPYRLGHWVYTDEWGWYWNSDEEFGWVTYHYGRWYLDRQTGWVWIPGDEWGPAFVNWRQGDDFVGWAPTPPDEYVDAEEEPDSYMFVRAGDLMEPDVYRVFIPYRERRGYYGRSSLVNRTVIFADRRGAVNPGIPPAYIASASGRPFRSSIVAPIVIAGTVGVAGAIILRNNFRDRSRTRISVRESNRLIEPGDRFHRLPGLNKGERARLGNNAPRGAQGGTPVLNLNSQGNSQKRQFRTKSNATQFEPKKPEERRIEPKQFEQKNIQRQDPQRKDFRQKDNQPQNSQQKTLERKSNTNTDRRSSDPNAGKRFEREKSTQKNIEQKNLQQKNLPQKNIESKNTRPGAIQPNSQQQLQKNTVPQHSQPREQPRVQQNTQPKTIQQNNTHQNTQRSAPQRPQTPPPSRGKPPEKDKK
jgi:hypothetical protein